MQPQNVNTKRGLLARSAGIFAIRIAPALAAAAVGIAFSHRLPRALNGRYQDIWVSLAVMLAVGGAGLQPFMLTHPGDAIDRWVIATSRRARLSLISWMGGCTVVFALLLHGEWRAAHPLVLCLLFSGQLLALLCETYLVIQRRFALVAGLSIGYSVLFCIVHFLFLRRQFDLGTLLMLVAGLGIMRAGGLAIGVAKHFFRKESLAYCRTNLRRAAQPMDAARHL